MNLTPKKLRQERTAAITLNGHCWRWELARITTGKKVEWVIFRPPGFHPWQSRVTFKKRSAAFDYWRELESEIDRLAEKHYGVQI